MHGERKSLRLGLVGPGRTRNGLGPFLARHLQAAGADVVAVVGRTAARTQAAARAMAADLGHAVRACATLDDLDGEGVHGLVIASPVGAHLAALEWAGARRLPTLCEKPLGAPGEVAAILRLVDAFAAEGVPLVENCQWPFVLPGVARLLGADAVRGVRAFGMRLSPAALGWAMVEESFSHLLSLLQALRPDAQGAELADLAFSTRAADAAALRVTGVLRGPFPPLAWTLELARHDPQPRPAWLVFDERRVEREVELPRYHWRLRANGATQSVGDPQTSVVYSLVDLIQEPDVDRTRALAAAIRTRARLFHAAWQAWG